MPKNKETKINKKRLASKITGGVLFGLVALLLGLQIIGGISARNNNGVATYGSYQTYRVQTDSMEPSYKVDTMIFVKDVDPSELKGPSSEGAKDGDVITFIRNHGSNYNLTGDRLTITHRITSIELIDGEYYFRTLGDNLNAKTCPALGCSASHSDWVKESDILGKVVGQSRVLGGISKMLVNPLFMLLFIMIPLLFIFGSSLVDLFKELKNPQVDTSVTKKVSYDDDFEAIKEQEKLRLMIEYEKERLRKEMAEGGAKDGEEE